MPKGDLIFWISQLLFYEDVYAVLHYFFGTIIILYLEPSALVIQ